MANAHNPEICVTHVRSRTAQSLIHFLVSVAEELVYLLWFVAIRVQGCKLLFRSSMTKKIICVGFRVPGSLSKSVSHKSQASILDADIVVFDPDISEYIGPYDRTYQGKPSLDENTSFMLKDNTSRWRNELLAAVSAGKTVFVFMTTAQLVVVDTGQRQYSGTGKNRFTTLIVSPFDPYSAIPSSSLGTLVRARGERMKPVGDLGMLAGYWHDFGPYSKYEVYLDGFKGKPRIVTQVGDMTVAAILRPPNSRGALILLPPPDLDKASADQLEILVKSQQPRKQTPVATGPKDHLEKARSIVGARFLSALTEIDKAIHAEAELTPPPAWTLQHDFVLQEESAINGELAEKEAQISTLRQQREDLLGKLNGAVVLKNLVFEKGKPLERAIVLALNALGFKAAPYKATDSEFDVVFVAPDGKRLLGEAEGKDDKAINIDKLDQLDRNVREDFQRPEITEYAKGVLFGNAYRFTLPIDRAAFFTEKCLLGAKRSGVALVRTTDLFHIARYLGEHDDTQFALACRKAILETTGEVVAFPTIPKIDS